MDPEYSPIRPPPFAPQQPLPPPAGPRGMGCFAKGCLTVAAVLLVLAVIVGVSAFFELRKLRDTFTSDHAVPIATYPATAQEYADVSARMRNFLGALDQNQSATLELSANDLNTLVARDPQYKGVRGKISFSIADDRLFVDTSAPLAAIPGLGGRYFNGKVGLTVSFENRDLHIEPVELETNGHRVGAATLKAFITPQYYEGLNKGFRREIAKNPKADERMKKIDAIEIKENKLVISSTGRSGSTP